MTPQEKRILNFMKKHGSITQRQAASLGCWRLSARISDLKTRGYRIYTELREVTNNDGSRTRIGVYHLRGEPENEGNKIES